MTRHVVCDRRGAAQRCEPTEGLCGLSVTVPGGQGDDVLGLIRPHSPERLEVPLHGDDNAAQWRRRDPVGRGVTQIQRGRLRPHTGARISHSGPAPTTLPRRPRQGGPPDRGGSDPAVVPRGGVVTQAAHLVPAADRHERLEGWGHIVVGRRRCTTRETQASRGSSESAVRQPALRMRRHGQRHVAGVWPTRARCGGSPQWSRLTPPMQ